MSNDLLPLPDILAEPPKESGRAAVAAEAAPAAAIVAVERNGRFLTEYPSGDSHPDMNGLPDTINRLDAVTPSDSPIEVPTPLADGLADAAVTVRQIESILQANGTLTLEVHFAVERIHDVAMALRMREVDTALCDTLEASIREVGDAIVRNDAAAARALSAAALLCDLSRRIDQMIPRTAVAVSCRNQPSGRQVLKRARTAPPARTAPLRGRRSTPSTLLCQMAITPGRCHSRPSCVRRCPKYRQKPKRRKTWRNRPNR
jgi:hypothetical protein